MGNIGMAASQPNYDVKNSADRFKIFTSSFQALKIHSTYTATIKVPTGNDGEFTVNTTTNVFTSAGHGLDDGEMIRFETAGTLPEPLEDISTGAIYYIISATTDTFKVSLTSGGTEIDITTSGSGTLEWDASVNKIIIEHDLEYLAPFIAINNGNSVDGTGTSYFMSGRQQIPTYEQKENQLEVTIGTEFDGLSAGDTVTWTFYIFLDDFRTVLPSNVNSVTAQTPTGDNYGIKVSIEGVKVRDALDTELQFSSAFSNLIVHRKGTSTGSSVAHDLEYIPAYLSFMKYSGDDFLSYVPTLFNVDTSDINLTLGAGDTAYYIIFKQTV